MTMPSSLLVTTCDIYRPFGAGAPTTTGVRCRLVPDLYRGRGLGPAGSVLWTHYLEVDSATDIQDGCTRLAGQDAVIYADGDEVRIPDAAGSRFVVVWVEMVDRGSPNQFKRAYLVRDTAVWPGP